MNGAIVNYISDMQIEALSIYYNKAVRFSIIKFLSNKIAEKVRDYIKYKITVKSTNINRDIYFNSKLLCVIGSQSNLLVAIIYRDTAASSSALSLSVIAGFPHKRSCSVIEIASYIRGLDISQLIKSTLCFI